MNFATLFGSLVDVTLVGILLGAGLPALFALGIRLAHGPETSGASTLGKVAATICFGIIIVAIFIGILWITKSTLYQYVGWDIFNTES